jgi:hypothetical protein
MPVNQAWFDARNADFASALSALTTDVTDLESTAVLAKTYVDAANQVPGAVDVGAFRASVRALITRLYNVMPALGKL